MSTPDASALGGRSLACWASRRIREPRCALLLGAAAVLLDFGLLGAGWVVEKPSPGTTNLIVWTLLVTAASLVPLTSGLDRPVLSMDLPLLLGASFVFGPTVAGTVAFLGCIDLRDFRRELSLTRGVFDRAQVSLSVIGAGFAFRLANGHLGNWPSVAVAGLVALVVDGLINYSLVAFMTSMRMRRPLGRVVRDMRFGPAEVFVPTYACFGFIGLLLAEAFVVRGLWGVFAFTAPILLARQAFLHRRSLEVATHSLRARANALRRVDERIADERRDERTRIAEALHDEVLQTLYNVTIRTHVIKEDLRSGRLLELDDDVPELLAAAEHAVEEMRDMIRDLRRSPLARTGIEDTITLLVNHLNSETDIRFVSTIEPIKAEPDVQLLIYQIAREALMNAVKHSAARAVWLHLSESQGVIDLVVEDDGKGFDVDAVDDRHFGLELMYERSHTAAGELSVRSKPGQGTTIVARIPTSR